MARPTREAIETFMSITGVTESVALQKLEEHGGDLNSTVDAHFNEEERNVASRSIVDETAAAARRDNLMDIGNSIRDSPLRSPLSLLSAARYMDPFSMLDQHFSRGLFGGVSEFRDGAPTVTHPREVRQIPIEVKDGNKNSGQSRDAPIIEDVTDTIDGNGPDIHGIVTIDDKDDEDVAVGPSLRASQQYEPRGFAVSSSYDDLPEYGKDIEEEMIQAAIEASKKEAERFSHKENELGNPEETAKVAASSYGRRLDARAISMLDEDNVNEQPLFRSRSGCTSATSSEARVHEVNQSSSRRPQTEESSPQYSRNPFHSDVWGGISSHEHDEAVMLEAAMFGGLPKGEHQVSYVPYQFMRGERPIPRWEPHPPSPSLEAQRLIREEQADEYLASLKADREKELTAKAEAETHCVQEEAARKDALKAEWRREEEECKQLEEEKELERQLAAKEASLPQEPPADDAEAVALLVRMPDGSRHGRRFFKSDKLQLLFDFIEIGRTVKPGTYRLVRPFPRRAFSNAESTLTLNELGLTSKQEALFLELM